MASGLSSWTRPTSWALKMRKVTESVAFCKQTIQPIGGLWWDREWRLDQNVLVPRHSGSCDPCPHAHVSDTSFVVPFVAIAFHDDRWGESGVCAECISEAIAKAKQEQNS